MRRPRRNHTAAAKGEQTMAELTVKFDVHANQITQWRMPLIEAATGVFLTPAEKPEEAGAGPSVKDMQAKIGQQALEIDFLAGVLGRFGEASAKKLLIRPLACRSIANPSCSIFHARMSITFPGRNPKGTGC